MQIQNNSMAMIATVALVGVLASLIGFFDPTTCSNSQIDGWTSCQSIANDRKIGSIVLLTISLLGFAVSAVRTKTKR
jgi:peroxiredoxin